jgi:hypothetical protein
VGSVHGSNDQKEKKKGERVLLILPELGGVATYVGYLPCASTRPCQGWYPRHHSRRSGILGAHPRSGYEDSESRTCAQSVWCVSGHPDDSVSTSTNHDLGLRKERKGRNAGAYTPDDLLNAKFSADMIGVAIVTKRNHNIAEAAFSVFQWQKTGYLHRGC